MRQGRRAIAVRAMLFAALVANTVPGCRQTDVSGPTGDDVLAFVADMPSNAPDGTQPQYTVFMGSGCVYQFAGSQGLLKSELSRADTTRLRDALLGSGIASQPPCHYFPPDAQHILLGIRLNSELKRYAWDERDFGPNAPDIYREFMVAWTKTRAELERAMPTEWVPATNTDWTIDQLLAEIHRQ